MNLTASVMFLNRFHHRFTPHFLTAVLSHSPSEHWPPAPPTSRASPPPPPLAALESVREIDAQPTSDDFAEALRCVEQWTRFAAREASGAALSPTAGASSPAQPVCQELTWSFFGALIGHCF